MPKTKKCQFKSQLDKGYIYICPEPALEGSGNCIFHTRLKTEEGAKLFQKKIENKLQNKDYVFTGFYFPNIICFASLLKTYTRSEPPTFEKDVNFKGSTFEKDADFGNVVFDRMADFRGSTFEGLGSFHATTFHGYADFSESLFEKFAEPEGPFFGDLNAKFADFEKAIFLKNAFFRKTVFRGWAIFRRSTFKQYADFENSTFERNAVFEESTFGEVCFKDSIFPGSATFRQSTFEKDADFRGSVFELDAGFKQSIFRGYVNFAGSVVHREAHFEDSTFEDSADFTGVVFHGGVDFAGSVVTRDADFEDSTFKKGADFTGAVFHQNVDFAGSIFNGNAVFQNVTIKNHLAEEKTFRIVKNNYQREGQYTLAGEYYYKEKIAKRKQLSWYLPKRWSEYILLDVLCGYGERPLRVIRTGLGILFCLAFLYWKVGHIFPSRDLFSETHALTFGDALYFSVVTFTTLGFGDWRPDPSHWIRYVVMSEAFIGAFLMALFIVTFARRMMR